MTGSNSFRAAALHKTTERLERRLVRLRMEIAEQERLSQGKRSLLGYIIDRFRRNK